MAGLAAVTVVVEAAERSGSLITARFAEELDREVAAVPGRVTSRMAAGSNRLIRDGAHVILTAADVLDALFGAGGWDGRVAPPRSACQTPPEPVLEPRLRRVLDAIEGGASVDAAAPVAGLTPAEARAALGRLELLGLLRRDALGGYERAVAR
jgi:DNA processing protein